MRLKGPLIRILKRIDGKGHCLVNPHMPCMNSERATVLIPCSRGLPPTWKDVSDIRPGARTERPQAKSLSMKPAFTADAASSRSGSDLMNSALAHGFLIGDQVIKPREGTIAHADGEVHVEPKTMRRIAGQIYSPLWLGWSCCTDRRYTGSRTVSRYVIPPGPRVTVNDMFYTFVIRANIRCGCCSDC